MKVWITKYALTDGIVEGELIAKHRMEDDYTKEFKILYLCKNLQGDQFYLKKDEFYYSLDSARFKAEQMRQEKIANLKKQIEELEEMKFDV